MDLRLAGPGSLKSRDARSRLFSSDLPRIARLHPQDLQRFEDQEGWPDDGFEEAQHAEPEGGGGADEIDGRADKAQSVHRAAATAAAVAVVMMVIVVVVVVHFLGFSIHFVLHGQESPLVINCLPVRYTGDTGFGCRGENSTKTKVQTIHKIFPLLVLGSSMIVLDNSLIYTYSTIMRATMTKTSNKKVVATNNPETSNNEIIRKSERSEQFRILLHILEDAYENNQIPDMYLNHFVELNTKAIALEGETIEYFFKFKNFPSEYLDLLLEAGITKLAELANLDHENLFEILAKTNQQKNIVRILPSKNVLFNWITDARKRMNEIRTIARSDINTIIVDEESSKIDSRLTPEYLELTVIPYLKAIRDLQMILRDLTGKDQQEVEIKAISKFSPLSISLEGASDALQLIREVVTPWRRKHSVTIANLLEVEKQIEIETKKAEILEKRAIAEKTRLETKKIKEEIKKMELENQQLGLILQKEKISLVIEILQKINPNLEDEDKITWISRLAPIIDRIIYSELEIN